MTRSEVVGHINKREPVLIAVSIEELKEEGQVPLDPKVEKLIRKFEDMIAEDVPHSFPLHSASRVAKASGGIVGHGLIRKSLSPCVVPALLVLKKWHMVNVCR